MRKEQNSINNLLGINKNRILPTGCDEELVQEFKKPETEGSPMKGQNEVPLKNNTRTEETDQENNQSKSQKTNKINKE